jgi:hypothetical protein
MKSEIWNHAVYWDFDFGGDGGNEINLTEWIRAGTEVLNWWADRKSKDIGQNLNERKFDYILRREENGCLSFIVDLTAS